MLRYLGWEGYADGHFAADLHAETRLEIEGESHLSDDVACRMVRSTPEAWDIININTPFVRDVLHPRGLIRALPEKFAAAVGDLPAPFARFKGPALNSTGEPIGIPQRCGPFNLVINQDNLAPAIAWEHGFGLALERDFHKRFGILAYEDFNVMHVAIAAGLNPFGTFDDTSASIFARAAGRIFQSAHIITTDHNYLNHALIKGDIDFYISGGVYTASPARLAGRLEVRAITPRSGPIGGRGGVAFVEINALVNHMGRSLEAGEAFLDYLASNNGSVAASLAAGACNPVVQMHRRPVFERFSREHLIAMQWEDFEEDMSRCADYGIMPDYEWLVAILRSESRYETLPH
jgi:spermidine/putrescine transport system substrate-binding protein